MDSIKELVSGECKYTIDAEGNLEIFSGIERIYKNDKKIYELKCSDGLIK